MQKFSEMNNETLELQFRAVYDEEKEESFICEKKETPSLQNRLSRWIDIVDQ